MLKNIVSPRQDLTFSQLNIYYEGKGFKLNDKFESSLELYTPEGKYNYVAYLLADENSISIKVAKYAGSDKYDLIENEEWRMENAHAAFRSPFLFRHEKTPETTTLRGFRSSWLCHIVVNSYSTDLR